MKKEDLLKRVYIFYIFPLFTGFLAALAPSWSNQWAIIWILTVLAGWGWARIGRVKKAHRLTRWRITYTIIQMDIAALFAAVPLWREVGEPVGLALFILLFYGLCAYFAHRYRQIVMRELISPKTKIGFFLLAVGVIGGGSAGAFAYATGDQLNHMFGQHLASILLGIMLIVGFAFLMVVFHAMWVKVDDPNWQADGSRM